jgi:protein-disulfide isomerase
MRLLLFLAVVCLSVVQAQDPNAWQKAINLPGVDLSALTPQQKTAVLAKLRAQDCTCGCAMKVAECRVKDPSCGFSTGLSQIIIDGVRAGKSAAQIQASIAKSRFAPGRVPPVLEDPVKLAIEGAPSKGPANAKITLVEFSDFQCPYCSQAIHQADAILAKYPKDVRLVFKQYPLENHLQAKLAAQASLAAHAQGKFWELHDRMFANYRQITRAKITEWAKEAGVDVARFNADLDSGKYAQRVETDLLEGSKAGVSATPTFFINGQKLNANLDLATIGPIVDAELKKKAVVAAR